MVKYIKTDKSNLQTINVTIFIEPIFYEDTPLIASVEKIGNKWITDNNPSRILNGPLSNSGQELEPPIKDEYERFIRDCKDMIQLSGFTIINSMRSTVSNKSEYVIFFGMNDEPYGKVVVELRISDHVLDKYEFPSYLRQKALEYLKMNKILDGSATEANIDFQIEKVVVGGIKNDTWARALIRLGNILDAVRVKIRKIINRQKQFDDE